MPELGPAELADRGIAPVRRSHWKPEGQEQPDQPGDPPGKAAGKSKKQQKRERKQERRKGGVCTSFLQGACQYGDSCRSGVPSPGATARAVRVPAGGLRCRFGHDPAEYLSSAPPNLPGPCPMQDACTAGDRPAGALAAPRSGCTRTA